MAWSKYNANDNSLKVDGLYPTPTSSSAMYHISYHIICTFLVRRYTIHIRVIKTTAQYIVWQYQQPNACSNKCVFKSLQNTVCQSVSFSDGGRLFQTKAPATEKARSPNLVRVPTMVAALAVADRRRLLVLVLWHRKRAKLDLFSINVQLHS